MQGQVVGNRYRLVSALGRGATASVWLAHDEVTAAEVALKVASVDVAARPQARARLLREGPLAARVDSPHVVRVLDHGLTDDGQPYLVMEYLAGATLDERLRLDGRLSLVETTHVVASVCAGLSRAHETGLVHRDLKPQNVFYRESADYSTPPMIKILDFGAAKAADRLADPDFDPTRTGDLVGTPCYMSPEQAKGARPA
jgi:serine/threonine-protein kinase